MVLSPCRGVDGEIIVVILSFRVIVGEIKVIIFLAGLRPLLPIVAKMYKLLALAGKKSFKFLARSG